MDINKLLKERTEMFNLVFYYCVAYVQFVFFCVLSSVVCMHVLSPKMLVRDAVFIGTTFVVLMYICSYINDELISDTMFKKPIFTRLLDCVADIFCCVALTAIVYGTYVGICFLSATVYTLWCHL